MLCLIANELIECLYVNKQMDGLYFVLHMKLSHEKELVECLIDE